MTPQTLWVPFSGLNRTTHSVPTRLVWLLLGRQPLTTEALSRLSGLNAKTVAAARAKLAAAPLEPCFAKAQPACAAMPWRLLTDAEVSVRARLLYGQLQSVPDFAGQSGSFTYAALSRMTGASDDTLRLAVAELVGSGWLTTEQAHRKSALRFTLCNPVSAHLRARISSVRRKVKNAQFRGEALLREFLNLLIATDKYKDDAAPDFLVNPFTRELMELDRYYPPYHIGIELNGAQHYEKSERATFEQTVKQVGRDAMKAFICKARGIELVVLHPEDLGLKSLDDQLPRRLPRRELQGHEALVAALEELAAEYRERSAEEWARQGLRHRTSRAPEADGPGRNR